MNYLHTIHFKLDEANNLLEEIKPQINEMIDLKSKIDEKGYDIFAHKYFGGEGPNGMGAFPAELEKLVEIVKEISLKGIQIRGINNGLIDFPHIRTNGDEVYLCWMHGENEIGFWHTIPDGYKGRKNITEL